MAFSRDNFLKADPTMPEPPLIHKAI